MPLEEKDEGLQSIESQEQPTDQPGQEPNQPAEEKPVVQPPDEKAIRNALAGDESFDLGDVKIDDLTPGDNQDAPPEPPKEPSQETPEKAEQKEPSTGLQYEQLWNRVKSDFEKQFGEGSFKMPEDINQENEYEVLLNFFQKNLEPDLGDLPYEAQEIIELHRKGEYNPDKYFEERSKQNDVLKLPDQDLLFEIYRAKNGKSDENPDGYSDDDIKEFLSKKTRIELHEMAEATRGQIKQLRDQVETERKTKAQQLREKEIELVQKKQDELAKKIVNQFQSSRDFFGIEFTPEDKAQYDKDFMEMVKVNKETGTHKIAELLNDDAILYKVGAILWKGEGLKGYITDIKESVKRDTERKLDPKLEEQRGSTKIARPVDRGKLV